MAILETRRQKQTVIVIGVYGLTIYTLYSTFRQSHSFVQWTIKLNQGFSFIILSAFMLLNFLLIWQGLTTLLFDELRLIEQEHIFERLPLIVIPMIMIVSQFNSSQMFNVLLFSVGFLIMQVFTWILKDRLEGLLQTINEHTTLTKLVFSNFMRNMIIFAILNYFTTKYTFFNNLKPFYKDINSVNIVLITFGYNFASILNQYLNLLFHTILNFYAFYYTNSSRHHNHHINPNSDEIENSDDDDDDDDEREFEGKFMYEKYIDVITKLFDVILDLTFGIPFKFRTFYIKDLVMDTVILVKRSVDIYKMWKNNKKLSDKLPDIIPEDLIDHDNICIVCMDNLVERTHQKKHKIEVPNEDQEILFTQEDIKSMNKNKRPKILPCGHMLHFSCLKHWMERSQTCPTCRLPVFDEKGNVKPVQHHKPYQRNSTINSQPPTPTPTQDTHTSNRSVESSISDINNMTGSNKTTHSGSPLLTISTATEEAQRKEISPILNRRMIETRQKNRSLKYGEWSVFQVKEKNADGSNIKFEVKNDNSSTTQVELIVTPNENLQNSIITIPDTYLEGRRHI